jgi:hypothetical protein
MVVGKLPHRLLAHSQDSFLDLTRLLLLTLPSIELHLASSNQSSIPTSRRPLYSPSHTTHHVVAISIPPGDRLHHRGPRARPDRQTLRPDQETQLRLPGTYACPPTYAPRLAALLTCPSKLIDSDPHFKRVLGYARGSDYLAGAAFGACGPALMLWWERISPSEVGKGGFASIMRLSGFVSLSAGFLLMYSRSQNRFYGWTENRREIEMDMREMTDRVKKGVPLYGKSTLTEYMQGIASRQSRYSGVWLHVMPWFNFVNHPHHGVDTAKYYRNAEKELEAESRLGSRS